jgi:hypothetical protein
MARGKADPTTALTGGAPAANDTRPARARPLLVRLADVETESIEWAWPGRIPYGKFTLVIGDPGVGKSYMAGDLEARQTTGRPWPDRAPAVARDVVVLTAEDGLADTVKARFERQRGDPDRLHVLVAVEDDGGPRPFDLSRDLAALEDALLQTRARWVRIDPLSAYLGPIDSHKDGAVRGLLAPLVELAAATRAAVVGIMHMTKEAQRRLITRALGSIGFAAAARVVLAVGPDPEDPSSTRRLFVTVKSNLGPHAAGLAFSIDDRGLTWEDEPLPRVLTGEALLDAAALPTSREEATQLAAAKAFLDTELKEGPVPSTQVQKDARANGIAQRTLWRAKAAMGISADRDPPTKAGTWFWSLPKPRAGSWP